eukprot:SAG22_NODE_2716_length_2284_cov_20.078261_2_plen_359_part_00
MIMTARKFHLLLIAPPRAMPRAAPRAPMIMPVHAVMRATAAAAPRPRRRLHIVNLHTARRRRVTTTGAAAAVAAPAEYRPPTAADVARYNDLGFLLVKNVLSPAEVELVTSAMEQTTEIEAHEMSIDDSLGSKAKQVLWNRAGHGTLGLLTRSERICGVAEQLLGGPVHHYFNKRLLKKAGDQGVWQWHQDYSYWYKDFFLFPDMQTIWVALDKADRSNGCLKVLRRSNKMGRIDHFVVGGQQVADAQRVEQLEAHPLGGVEYCEMEPGDAIFFHGTCLVSADTVSICACCFLFDGTLLTRTSPFSTLATGTCRTGGGWPSPRTSPGATTCRYVSRAPHTTVGHSHLLLLRSLSSVCL